MTTIKWSANNKVHPHPSPSPPSSPTPPTPPPTISFTVASLNRWTNTHMRIIDIGQLRATTTKKSLDVTKNAIKFCRKLNPSVWKRRAIRRMTLGPASSANNGHKVPITSKIRERHLELEPLCCIDSCLVRGGCSAVIAFEVAFVCITMFAVLLRIINVHGNDDYWRFWSHFEFSFNAIVTHQLFLYLLVAFDAAIMVHVCILALGLIRFDQSLLLIHWKFQHIILGVCSLAFVIYTLALSIPGGRQTWTMTTNILIVFAFGIMIPIQLWALSVVKSCHDYFKMIKFFIHLADA